MGGKIDWDVYASKIYPWALPEERAKLAKVLAYWYEKGYDRGMDAAQDMEMGIAPRPWDEEDDKETEV